MSKRFKLALGAGLAVMLLTAVMVSSAFAQGTGPRGWRGGGMMGGGMMGGWRSDQQVAPGTSTAPGGGYGCGMMGGYGPGMMGNWGAPINANPISMDQAVAAAQAYVQAYNNPDLALAEVMEFTNNFYVRVTEKSTGTGAFELLVDRYTGVVFPEYGPNMMWNTKYGMMGGMMGRGRNLQTGPMPITVVQARANAQQFLDANFPGAKLADDADTFYGYYTMDFLQNGNTAGMLSVNGYTGQVWYHTWHGNFVSEKSF